MPDPTPQDQEQARAIVDSYGPVADDGDEGMARAIATALAEQRERCAQIADVDVAYRLDHDHGPCTHDCRDAPERIAAAIRGLNREE